MLTVIIKIMTVIRKKPETTWRVKEVFTEEVIFKFGLELTIKKKKKQHCKHSGCPSEGHTVNYGISL